MCIYASIHPSISRRKTLVEVQYSSLKSHNETDPSRSTGIASVVMVPWSFLGLPLAPCACGSLSDSWEKTGARRKNHITLCSCSMISSQSYFLFVCATNRMEWCCLQSVRLQGKLSFDRARFKRAGCSRLSSFAGKVTGDHVVLQLLHSLSSSLCIFSVSFHKAAVSCMACSVQKLWLKKFL